MERINSPQILGSWKEIAAYLGKGVRTVQRWELLHGLPVRRPKGAPRGVVYASHEDLDLWLQTQWQQRNFREWNPNSVPSRIPTSELVLSSEALCHSNRELLASITHTIERIKEQCAQLAITGTQLKKVSAKGEAPSWSGVA